MPSYLRLLTEKPSNITTPPLGHTALFASSGTTPATNQYDLYIMNPDGFVSQVGGFQSGGTFSGNIQANSGITVYSGGYTSSGSPNLALAFDGDLSATTSLATLYVNNIRAASPMNLDNHFGSFNSPNTNARFNFNSMNGPMGNMLYLGVPNTDNGITVHIPSGTTGLTHAITLSGSMSGTNSVAFGLNQTSNHGFASSGTALYTAVFNSGNTVSNSGATAFGSGNTSSGPFSFTVGGNNTVGVNSSLSFAGGSGNTVSGNEPVNLAFGAGNTVSGGYGVAFGKDNVSSGLRSAVFGSGTTSSGNTHFVLGNHNITSHLFVVGNATTQGGPSNIITTRQSGITISQSGGTLPEAMTNGTNGTASFAVMSGSGSHPLGFKLPMIELNPAAGSEPAGIPNWAPLTGATGPSNTGIMFWDGQNIKVYTGQTFPYYATLATLGGGGSL